MSLILLSMQFLIPNSYAVVEGVLSASCAFAQIIYLNILAW